MSTSNFNVQILKLNSFTYFCTGRAPSLFALIDPMPLQVLHKPAVSVIPTQTITGLRRDRHGAIRSGVRYKRMATLVPEGIIKPQSAAQSLSPQDPLPNPPPGLPKTHPARPCLDNGDNSAIRQALRGERREVDGAAHNKSDEICSSWETLLKYKQQQRRTQTNTIHKRSARRTEIPPFSSISSQILKANNKNEFITCSLSSFSKTVLQHSNKQVRVRGLVQKCLKITPDLLILTYQ